MCCRVLELDAESADALLGLAMIAFGSTQVQEGLNSGLQYLQRAYAADPSHPGVLCVLSHFSMVKGMYEEVSVHDSTHVYSLQSSKAGQAGAGFWVIHASLKFPWNP
jgi:hypothetical protein